MADWSQPLLSTAYSSFLSIMKDRDFDAFSLGLNAPTNPVTGMIRYVRASNKFQEYDGAVWVDKVLALEGGGTGASIAADARTNLGLGTIAVQSASGVNITGGVIGGLSSLGVAGAATIAGQIIAGSGAVPLTTAGGKIQALTSTYFQSLAFDAVNLIGGPYPALNGSAITALNASALASGTVPVARMGSGANGINFLRSDNTWQEVQMIRNFRVLNVNSAVGSGNIDVAVSALTDINKCFVSFLGTMAIAGSFIGASLVSTTLFRFSNGVDSMTVRGTLYIIEFM